MSIIILVLCFCMLPAEAWPTTAKSGTLPFAAAGRPALAAVLVILRDKFH